MAHELLRLTQRLCNKPQLISLDAISVVMGYLDERNKESLRVKPPEQEQTKEPAKPMVNGTVGMLSIEGALTNIKYEGICGEEGCSYEGLIEKAEQLVAEGVETIILDIDSGGGEAYGCFESASQVRQLATDNNVKLITYVDGVAASAAYAWASIADEIIVNPMAKVGSIGVVVQLMNTIKFEKSKGLERVFIYAGDSKIPFDVDGNFTESFISDIQESVNFYYSEFTSFVETRRPMTLEQIQDTEAKVYLPKEALSLGLIDKVMTKQEFINYAFS